MVYDIYGCPPTTSTQSNSLGILPVSKYFPLNFSTGIPGANGYSSNPGGTSPTVAFILLNMAALSPQSRVCFLSNFESIIEIFCNFTHKLVETMKTQLINLGYIIAVF